MSLKTFLFGWIVKPIIKKEIGNMFDKLKPILDFLAGQPARVFILVLTFGGLAGLIYMKMDGPWMVGAVVISGAWAQWMNYKVQHDKKK